MSQAALSHTPWQMNRGEGLVTFPRASPSHGDVMEYDFATIPPADDPGWGPAPDGATIGFNDSPSSLCGVLACFTGAQFTYFQTFVDVPANVVVTTFTISFSGIDDGSRTTIFNSAHPGGAVVPGSFVVLGSTGTADLSTLVKSGEVNRVVVTHVDDCCDRSTLASAVVVLNGQPRVDCSAAGPTIAMLWPPDHKLVDVGVQGVTDLQGQPVTIRIDNITQDEPTNSFGDGDTCPDADGVGTDTARLRAERSGTPRVPGDGRVYHIDFTATDPDGFSCTGQVVSCVPHDQGRGATCIDEGRLFSSLSCP